MILDLQYLLLYWLKPTQFLNLKEKCFQFTLETQRLNESYSYLLKIYQKEFIHSLKNVFVPSKYCESILILTNDNILKHFKTRSKKIWSVLRFFFRNTKNILIEKCSKFQWICWRSQFIVIKSEYQETSYIQSENSPMKPYASSHSSP